MKKMLLLITILLTQTNINAQKFKPSKEDVQKYEPMLIELAKKGEFGKNNIPTDIGLAYIDSLYAADTNSLYLKDQLINFNLNLMYDSLIMDRNPQTISIFKSYINMLPNDKRHYIYPTLALIYKHSGNFKEAIRLYEKSLKYDLGSFKTITIRNLTATYLGANQNKKALQTAKLLMQPDETDGWNSTLAKVYYKNNLLDSALILIDLALTSKKIYYSTYIIKAKILETQGKTNEVCSIILQASEQIEKEGVEYLIRKRDISNPFIKLLLDDVEEVKQLKAKYCN